MSASTTSAGGSRSAATATAASTSEADGTDRRPGRLPRPSRDVDLDGGRAVLEDPDLRPPRRRGPAGPAATDTSARPRRRFGTAYVALRRPRRHGTTSQPATTPPDTPPDTPYEVLRRPRRHGTTSQPATTPPDTPHVVLRRPRRHGTTSGLAARRTQQALRFEEQLPVSGTSRAPEADGVTRRAGCSAA